MKRALLVVCAALTLSTAEIVSAQANPKPNIVFLLADDMGYSDLGCFGSPIIKTPNIDQIAAGGMRLLSCYSASPNCSPARTGILTGRHPYRVGMYDFARFKEMHIPKDEYTIAEAVKSAGYQTMFAGKWHCSGDFPSQPNPGDHGFDHWLANATNFGPNPTSFYRNGKRVPLLKGWMSEIVVNEALDFLKARDRSKPFMTMLWFSEPHTPVVADAKFIKPYDNEATKALAKTLNYGGPHVDRRKAKISESASFYGCVSMLDYNIGRLIDYLKAEDLDANTIIVFTSDNGPEHRTPSAFGTPGPFRGAKGHIHEGGYRVPGIIKWPAKIPAGSESAEPVCGTDFLPTLAAAAGVTQWEGKPLDGIDVWPGLIEGVTLERPHPLFWWLYHARGGKEVSMRVGDFKILANMLPQDKITMDDAEPPKGMSIMDFIKKSELGNFILYNLKDDPAETTDVSQKNPEKFEQLKKQLIAYHASIRAEAPYYKLTGGNSGE